MKDYSVSQVRRLLYGTFIQDDYNILGSRAILERAHQFLSIVQYEQNSVTHINTIFTMQIGRRARICKFVLNITFLLILV